MNTSPPATNGHRRPRRWYRRGHRWVGVSVVIFVLFLSASGIMLNHGSDLELDRRYVDWPWILDAYGLQTPSSTASFADSGHRATLLGERVFFDGQDLESAAPSLTGIVLLGPLVLVSGERAVTLLTTGGEVVESMDLSANLPGSIERLGRNDGHAVIQSGGTLYRSDPDVAVFELWPDGSPGEVTWSAATPPDAADMKVLERAYRGRGVTVERVLLDLHSGRIFSLPGTILMDVVAIGMIALSLSGLFLSTRRKSNGRKG